MRRETAFWIDNAFIWRRQNPFPDQEIAANTFWNDLCSASPTTRPGFMFLLFGYLLKFRAQWIERYANLPSGLLYSVLAVQQILAMQNAT